MFAFLGPIGQGDGQCRLEILLAGGCDAFEIASEARIIRCNVMKALADDVLGTAAKIGRLDSITESEYQVAIEVGYAAGESLDQLLKRRRLTRGNFGGRASLPHFF